MKHLIFILTLMFNSLALSGQYDILYDSTFSGDGVAFVPYSLAASKGVFLQPDGKMVLLAQHNINFDTAVIAVWRLLANGAQDLPYNSNAIHNPPTLFGNDPNPVGLLLPNNELLVAGSGLFTPWYSSSLILHKYREDGTMDNLFGNGGAVILTEDSLSLYCQDLKIYKDTSFLALYGGSFYSTDTFIQRTVICKIDIDGRIDSSFAINGKLELPSNILTNAQQIVISDDGSIYVLGNYNANNDYHYVVIKLNPDFTIDPGFQFEIDNNNFDYSLADIGVDEDAKLIIAANKWAYGFKLWRFMPNGSLDNSFSKDGVFDETHHGDVGYIGQLMVQPDGKLLISITGGATAMRLNPNGTMDYSFDLDGVAEILPNSDVNFNYVGSSGLERQPDGKLIFMTEDENDYIKVIRVRIRP